MTMNPNDIRNIRPNGIAPKKIGRIIGGELKIIPEIKKVINNRPVIVWKTGEAPEPPVIDFSKLVTVWNIEAGQFVFPVLQTGANPPTGTIDWGDGTSEDYISSSAKTHVYASSGIYTITVDCNITQLSSVKSKGYSFYNQKNLISVVLPDTIESLSVNGRDFEWCEGLKSVALPKNINEIPDYTFHYCVKLESVIIPEGVESIGTYAIARCYTLNSVTLPNTLVNIGEDAFTFDYKLASITIPSSVQTIAYNAFTGISRGAGVPARIYVHKPANSIPYAPWSADDNAEVIWLG